MFLGFRGISVASPGINRRIPKPIAVSKSQRNFGLSKQTVFQIRSSTSCINPQVAETNIRVFDETHQQYTTLSLFPEDREIPPASSNSIQVRLSEMQLRGPQAFGNCWLGCELWRQLRLEEFWEEKLAEQVQRETVSWAKVPQPSAWSDWLVQMWARATYYLPDVACVNIAHIFGRPTQRLMLPMATAWI